MTELAELGAREDAVTSSAPKPEHALRRLLRQPRFAISAALVLLVLVMAAFPWLFTSIDGHDPANCDLGVGITGPSAAHWFGTDTLGCDYYSKVIYGARPSIVIGLAVTIASFVISAVVGSIAGYVGGWVDGLISRICDVMFGLPFMLGAIVVLQLFEQRTVATVCLALTLFYWPGGVRFMRSAVLGVRNREYVQASKVLGAGNVRILRRHVIPNSLTPLVVLKTLGIGGVIAAEAGLTFIGIGLAKPAVSWGLQLADAKTEITTNPHLLLFPSIFLSVTVLAFVLFGESVRDALDPKNR
ncbi:MULTISPECIES: ABC transporter permease [unclassified Isoptericola]|uniref:ABC transporter permease n=1 Tax=unclassified Isoptericola TaxID=2623355 RepID=UPI00364F1405